MLGAVLAFGCASPSATGVPNLDARQVYTPHLPGLAGRALRISVTDRREPKPERSADMVRALEDALEAVFERASVKVQADAGNSLDVVVTYTDEIEGNDKEDCAKLTLDLKLSNGNWAKAVGGSCYAYKHWLGFRMESDTDRVFKGALETALKQLEQALAAK